MSTSTASPLIHVEGLVKHFPVRLGRYGQEAATVHAVDGISFEIARGETLGLVGESGCGKSTTGQTMLQLTRPTAGSVHYDGMDLTAMSQKELRSIRRKLQIVFQDPYSTLNPRMTVGAAITEPMLAHKLYPKGEACEQLSHLMDEVGLCARYNNRYPHEFSGGQRQRVCIARALACDPEFIVCDEPVSALDVSVQAQIVNLLLALQEKYQLTYLFIAHDLAVVRYISDRVAVMYLGKLAEMAPKEDLFEEPLHPYTRALLSAVPVPNPKKERKRERERIVLTGDVPSAIQPPSGCRFHPRCPIAMDVCRHEIPTWREVQPRHWVACHAVE